MMRRRGCGSGREVGWEIADGAAAGLADRGSSRDIVLGAALEQILACCTLQIDRGHSCIARCKSAAEHCFLRTDAALREPKVHICGIAVHNIIHCMLDVVRHQLLRRWRKRLCKRHRGPRIGHLGSQLVDHCAHQLPRRGMCWRFRSLARRTWRLIGACCSALVAVCGRSRSRSNSSRSWSCRSHRVGLGDERVAVDASRGSWQVGARGLYVKAHCAVGCCRGREDGSCRHGD